MTGARRRRKDPHKKAAADLLTQAAHALQMAGDLLRQAADELASNPETYRIASLEDGVDEMIYAVNEQTRRVG